MSKLSRLRRLGSRRADPPASIDPSESGDSSESDRDEPQVQRAPRTRAQRVYLALFLGIVGVFVVSVLWIVVTGLVARARLNDVKGELKQLRSAAGSGDVSRARALARHIEAQTASAHELTSGPAWWVGSNIPVLGTPLRTGRIVAQQANLIGRDALPGILDLSDQLVQTSGTRGSLDLGPLQRVSTGLARSQRIIHRASLRVRGTAASWLPLVSGPRRDVVSQLSALDGEVGRASNGISAALPMLGSTRPQRYFLGFMNEAEARGLGGLPGAFAIFTVDRGQVHFTHFGSDDELLRVRASISVSAEYKTLYAQDHPTEDIRNSDVSPHFPDAARIWAAMWQAKSGQRVDGAIAVDPSAIGFLLDVTGAATLPDGSKVTGANVVTLTQERQYELYGSSSIADTQSRKNYLVGIARAVAGRVLTAPALRKLAGPTRKAIEQRRLVLWSADAAHERAITALGLGGTLSAPTGSAFSSFVINNAAGGKMDLYLDRTMSYTRSSCATGTATATLTLHNDTPNYALPPYVTTVLGNVPAGAKPGFNRSIVAYYASKGATITAMTVDGAPVSVTLAPEQGIPSGRVVVDLPAGATRVVRVTIREPATHHQVSVLRQPGVRDIRVHIDQPTCQ